MASDTADPAVAKALERQALHFGNSSQTDQQFSRRLGFLKRLSQVLLRKFRITRQHRLKNVGNAPVEIVDIELM